MSELYWITRLNAINTFLALGFIVSIIICVIAIIGYICNTPNRENMSGYSKPGNDFWMTKFKKTYRITLSTFFLFSFCFIFTPTTNEMYLIYGVGGTIDYIRQDSIASQLPHKTIEALDKWVDKISPQQQKQN